MLEPDPREEKLADKWDEIAAYFARFNGLREQQFRDEAFTAIESYFDKYGYPEPEEWH